MTEPVGVPAPTGPRLSREVQLVRTVAREAVHALALVRLTRKPPMPEDAPTAFALHAAAVEVLRRSMRSPVRFDFNGIRLEASGGFAIDRAGALEMVEVRSAGGALLLRGDAAGPVFVDPKARAAR